MDVVLHGFRFHAPYTTECDSVEEAISTAVWQQDMGVAAPDRITTTDGKVLLGPLELDAAVEAYEREQWLAREERKG